MSSNLSRYKLGDEKFTDIFMGCLFEILFSLFQWHVFKLANIHILLQWFNSESMADLGEEPGESGGPPYFG